MRVTERTVTVEWTFDGYHQWPDASTVAGEQRAYLESRHRHRFECSVTIPVVHSDRAVEFHDLLDYCTTLVDDSRPTPYAPAELEASSCEHIGEFIGMRVLTDWPTLPWVTVAVSEDGYVTGSVRIEQGEGPA